MKLYEYDKAIDDLIDRLTDKETGELRDDFEELEEELKHDKAKKVLSVGKYIKNLQADSEGFDKAIKSMQAREKVVSNKIESIKCYLSNYADGDKYEDAECAIGWRKSKSVNIIDEDKVSSEYKSEEITVSINKTEIKKALGKGESIEGAELVTTNNIQIK